MLAPAVVSLDDVCIRYGDRIAVDALTLQIQRGELFGLLGPNGSGKSSTLSAIAGIRTPASGCIRIDGRIAADNPLIYARLVGLVPQEPAIYDELTVGRDLRFFGELFDLHGHDLRHRIRRALERIGLSNHADTPVKQLSGGMQRRVNLAIALLHEPAVLLLDEPTVALDPATREMLFTTLMQLRDEGQTIILTTHLLDEAELWCDRIGVLQSGRLTALGKPADLVRNPLREPVLYGHLRERPPAWREKAIRSLLADGVELEITGQRVRLSASSNEQLGQSLRLLLKHGLTLDRFQTPPIRLEHLLQPSKPIGGIACDAA